MTLDFKVFLDKKGDETDPLEELFIHLKKKIGKDVKYEIFDINDADAREAANEIGLEEIPAILFNKIRISGQLNEYFLLAVIAQLLTTDGDDQKPSDIEMDSKKFDANIKVASEFFFFQSQMRDDTSSFLLLIRESPDDFDIDILTEAARGGTTIYLLTNFQEGDNGPKVANLGQEDNIQIGHIMRTNIHMTLSITVRKNRPFFGAYVRAKNVDGVWKGIWSPLLHDAVTELKKFYIPLFSTASPVHLDGELPETPETNRIIAKVKDGLETLKSLFF